MFFSRINKHWIFIIYTEKDKKALTWFSLLAAYKVSRSNAYSEPSKTTKREFFAKTVNDRKQWLCETYHSRVSFNSYGYLILTT